jgi:glycosyltransferase involved in cell wall biosynthesis
MIKLHLLTRCTRLSNLRIIRDTVFPSSLDVTWHIIFDTSIVKSFNKVLIEELKQLPTKLYFIESNHTDYLYPQLSDIIDTIDEGFVGVLDDDNILHSDFYKGIETAINQNPDKKAFVYKQYVGGKDFTGLKVRDIGPEHMKLQHIDSAQYIIEANLYKTRRYEEGYDADGRFIEPFYKEHADKFHFIDEVLCYYNHLKFSRKANLPRILYIGPGLPELRTKQLYNYEEDKLDVFYTTTDDDIESILINYDPHAIVTVGESDEEFPNLYNQSIEVRKKWIHVKEVDLDLGTKAYYCAMTQMLENNTSELISFFTPIYKTGEKLYRTYQSLVDQTYKNWEWVLIDDSTDELTTKIAEEIVSKDHRVKIYDFKEKSNGNIGEVKYRAAMLCKGYLLAELDHDDVVTEQCAEYLYLASKAYPDAGFFFTDWAEVSEKMIPYHYENGFGLGYGKYREEEYKGYMIKVCDQHNINPKTIRHIVGIPNHIRAWRRDVYLAIGGHNRNLTVTDDYDIVIRTFLKTKFCKIPKLGYLQFIYLHQNKTDENSQADSRSDIQRRVRTISNFYNEAIKQRFDELGVEDWAYVPGGCEITEVPSRYGDQENYVNYIFKI